MRTKVPLCSICQTRYNEDDRVPLLLQCGHCFCKHCLSRMFSASPDTTLTCPRCRHVSPVGNSVQALSKNYSVLPLLDSTSSNTEDFNYSTDEDSEIEDDEDRSKLLRRQRRGSEECGPVIEVGAHPEMRLVKRIGGGGEGGGGVETWRAVIGGGGWRCRHSVVVKEVAEEGAEMMELVERVRRGSMWCRNVCKVYGVKKWEGRLWIVMERCYGGSIQSAMNRNGGRLTLEQVLRYGADIARGVSELHVVGIACMNIKPSNLLLDSNGSAVVSDYGISTILKKPFCWKAQPNCDSSNIHLCMKCTVLNPHYAAPEAWGQPAKKSLNLLWDEDIGISAASDSWSFGCTLVEMCTGFLPWAGLNTDEICQAVVKSKQQPPQYASVVGGGIPSELWKMIGECLLFKPSKRPNFNALLAIFLRSLQEISHNLVASPNNKIIKGVASTRMEMSTVVELKASKQNLIDLHRFVSEGDVRGARDLLAKAASEQGSNYISSLLETQNAEGQTALHLACRRGSEELVRVILEFEEANVDVLDKDGDPPIVYALATISLECIRILLKRNANVKSRITNGYGIGLSLAHIVCASHGQPDCMRELLLAGADPNAVDDERESVLHRAVSKKYTDCAIVILENGGCRSMAILNSKNLTPLHLCVLTWNVAVVKRWVEIATSDEIGESINIQGSAGTALCMAAITKKDHKGDGRELVRILLAAGADPYVQDPHNAQTALHTAAMNDNVELVKVILDAGVDVNIRNAHNSIPLHLALARGANSCVGALLSAGADCNLQDNEGDNSLHIAAETARMIRENLDWLIVMLGNPNVDVEVRNYRQVAA
ncbi:hypothetical protein PIB30_016260 [Stylosanthes scabra]|uniref:RING-type E3 ubiquitin transferase n=1 Tax=Stylosanthes scabra TaxID=79078 RepID=A0ABU6Y4A3_9FABA|nr:hypothetical protein [Stylosanthes scabra]